MVTGCAGFIGAQVCELLLREGREVLGVDDLNDAYDVRLKEHRLALLRGHRGFRFARLDVRDRASLEALPDSVEAALHLAARAGVRGSLEDPFTYLATNAAGTLNLLEWCRRRDVRSFLLASTSSIYGGHNPGPFREDADTSRPLSPYAASKRAAESLAASYAHLYGLDVPVPRYFTVYGPAGRPDMSIFRLVRGIAEGSPVPLYGDGAQQRDFTYVEDIARGTVAALGVKGFEILNLGSDRPVALATVIAHLERLLGAKANLVPRPLHPADVRATWADIGKARRLLGWEPRVGLEEGLARTVEWYLKNREWACNLELGA